MSAPVLVMSGPPFAIPGRGFEVAVEVTAESPVHVEGISIRLRGVEGWLTSRSRARTSFVNDHVWVHRAGVLAGGTHRFVSTFTLPENSPPTHDTGDSYANLIATAAVHRGLVQSDVSARMPLEIRHLVAKRPSPSPSEASNGSYDDKLVLTVATRRLATTDTISGTLVGSNFGHERPVEAEVRLVSVTSYESLIALPKETVWATRRLTIPMGRAPVRFELALPRGMPLPFKGATCQLRWEVVASAGGRLLQRPSAGIALDIVDIDQDGALARDSGNRDRVRAALDELVTSHGWRWHDTVEGEREIAAAPLAVERELGAAIVRLAFAPHRPSGPSMIARVCYPSLELGLEVNPSSPFREMLSRDLEAGDAEWDRHHRVTARDRDPAVALVRAIVPAIVASRQLGVLVRWNDHEIEFAYATNDPVLVSVADELYRLAAVILAAVPSAPRDGIYR